MTAYQWKQTTFGALTIGQEFYWGMKPERGEYWPRRKVGAELYRRPAGQEIRELLTTSASDQPVYIRVPVDSTTFRSSWP